MATIYHWPGAVFNGDGTHWLPATSNGGVGAKNVWTTNGWAGGNKYLQCAGTVWTAPGSDGISVGISTGATDTNRLIIGSYNPLTGAESTAKAYIVGNGVNTTTGINILPAATYVTVQDFDVSNIGYGADVLAVGITLASSFETTDKYCIVQRCSSHDHLPNLAGSTGDVDGFYSRGAGNIWRFNQAWNIPTDGISIKGQYCTFHNNDIRAVATRGQHASECISLVGDVTGIAIYKNYLSNILEDTKYVVSFIGMTGTGGSFTDNVLVGNPAGFIECLYSEQPNLLIARNQVYDGRVGIHSHASGGVVINNLIVNRTSHDEAQKGAWLSGFDGQTLVGNTIVSVPGPLVFVSGNSQRGIYMDTGHLAHVVKNNIISGWRKGIRLDVSSGQTEDYNCIWNLGTGFALERALGPVGGDASGSKGSHTILSNPKLAEDFRPLLNAPVLKAGLKTVYLRDLTNTRRLNPPTIGAYDAATYRRLLVTDPALG